MQPRRQYLKLALSGASCSLIGLTGCSAPSLNGQKRKANTPTSSTVDLDSLRSKWRTTIEPYLKQPLWNEKNRYDAGHFLMIPFHSAFKLGINRWKSQIREHVSQFVTTRLSEIDRTIFEEYGALSILQNLYLYSQYLTLEVQYADQSAEPLTLSQEIYNIIQYLWTEYPSWHWGHPDFDGMKNRIAWKISKDQTDPNYHRAIIDSEEFLLAIAADLYQYYTRSSRVDSPPQLLEEILEYAYIIYETYGEFRSDDGWLFQPGVYSDHRDYQYACHTEKQPNLEPCEISGIARDSSHSLRRPLWIRSLKGAFNNKNENKYEFYQRIQSRYTIQFLEKVVVEPTKDFPVHRLNNYMDGRNGLYRWEYETLGENSGYGPYELSGSLTVGWWAFLNNSNVTRIYADLYESFPLSENVTQVFIGSDTSRERNKLIRNSNSYNNGFRELIVGLATKI